MMILARHKSLLFFLATVTTIGLSCKKDKENNPVSEKQGLLTKKEWVCQSSEMKSGNGQWVLLGVPDCGKDDRFIIRENASFEFNGGTIKCDPNESFEHDKGTWELKENPTRLILHFIDSDPSSAAIDFLDDSKLVVVYTDQLSTPIQYIRQTWVHP